MDLNEIPEKPKKKIWLNLVIVLIILLLLILWIAKTNDIGVVIETIKSAQINYILLGILVMIGYWLFTGLSLHIIIKINVGKKVSTFDSINISNSAFFFNGITPFSSGGQPFQLYYLRKKGVHSANSAGILMMNFIIYQIVLTILSTIFLIMFFNDLRTVDNFVILVLIGFSINTFIVLILIGCAISKNVKKICLALISVVFKIKPLRKYKDSAIQRTTKFVDDAQSSFRDIFKKKFPMLIAFCSQIIALVLFYSIPFFAFLALGYTFNFENYLMVVALTSFINMFMIWIPTPGSSGGAEWGFKTLFVLPVLGIFSTDAVAAMLIWRFLTYYLSIINGLISVILLSLRSRHREE